MSLVTPPTTTNSWIATVVARLAANSLPKLSRTNDTGAQAAHNEDEVEGQDRGEPDEAEFLTDGGDDEVGWRTARCWAGPSRAQCRTGRR